MISKVLFDIFVMGVGYAFFLNFIPLVKRQYNSKVINVFSKVLFTVMGISFVVYFFQLSMLTAATLGCFYSLGSAPQCWGIMFGF